MVPQSTQRPATVKPATVPHEGSNAAKDTFTPGERPAGMTDLTARVFHDQGIPQKELAELFQVTGNLPVNLAEPRQKLTCAEARFPAWDYGSRDSRMELDVPLSQLDVRPLTMSEFIAQLKDAKLRLPMPWAADPTSGAGEVTIDSSGAEPMLKLAFPHTNVNAVAKVQPEAELTLPSGQLVLLQVTPKEISVDTRAADIAQHLQQVPETEAQIAELKAHGGEQAFIDTLQGFVDRQKARAAEVAARPFAGMKRAPDYGT